MNKPLTTTERKLCAKVLELAANEFGNHGCTDYKIDDMPIDVRRGLVLAMERWNSVDQEDIDELIAEPDDSNRFVYTENWLLMQYLAARLRGEV